MKALYILLAIALIGVGWYLWQSTDATNEDGQAENTQTDDHSHEDGDHSHDDDHDHDEDAESANGANVEVDAEVTGPLAGVHVFEVEGTNFKFSDELITVGEGDTVTINFTSVEGFHDWVIDEFNAATERVSAGGTTSVTFVADQAGTFEFYCSVGSHRAQGMVGTLIVEAN